MRSPSSTKSSSHIEASASAGTTPDGAVRAGIGAASAGAAASAGEGLSEGTAGADRACTGRVFVRRIGPAFVRRSVTFDLVIGPAAAVLEAAGQVAAEVAPGVAAEAAPAVVVVAAPVVEVAAPVVEVAAAVVLVVEAAAPGDRALTPIL